MGRLSAGSFSKDQGAEFAGLSGCCGWEYEEDGRDGDQEPGYIANMQDSATAGFKYFDCRDVQEIRIKVRGYGDGVFEVRTAWDGEILAKLKVEYANVWEEYAAPVRIPDGIQAIWLTYRGNGNVSLLSFILRNYALSVLEYDSCFLQRRPGYAARRDQAVSPRIFHLQLSGGI